MISNDELPKAEPRRINNNNNLGLPPTSNEKLISSTGRLPPRRNKDVMPQYNNEIKRGNEQIYSKKDNLPNSDNNSSRQGAVKNVTVEFMKPNANFIYQNLIEFNRIYSILYFVMEILIFVYKVNTFTYPNSYTSGLEISSLVFYLIVQLGRLYFGELGNREEYSFFIILSLIFSIGAIYTYVHFLVLQTFVVRIELVINGIGMFLWLIELLSSILAVLSVSKQEGGM